MVLCFSICSFFSAARRTNKEAPPLLSGLFARPLLPPSGAAELASLRQSSPGFLRRQAPSRPDKGVFPCRTCLLFFQPLSSVSPLYHFVTQRRSLKCSHTQNTKSTHAILYFSPYSFSILSPYIVAPHEIGYAEKPFLRDF